MKRGIILGALALAISLLLVPCTSAVHHTAVTTAQEELLQNLPSKTASTIRDLLSDYPDLVRDLEDGMPATNTSGLQTFWTIVLYYRIFRLTVSFQLFKATDSNFFLSRSITWAIKVLKWVHLGILLGYVNQPSQTPEIDFKVDYENNTITVLDVEFSQPVAWTNISQTANGSCDPLPNGTVAAGDQITNCTGHIVLTYVPTAAILLDEEFS